MPPKNPIEDFIMKVKTPTGEWQDIPDPHLVPEPLAEHIDYASGSDFTNVGIWLRGDDSYEICGTFQLPPITRKRLSRKRIRKVLMSIGIPRNKADFQSRDMVQTLDMDSRKIEILAITLSGPMFGRKA